MGLAVQANLMTLVVADAKRRGIAPNAHEIKVNAPGAVKYFRETLIDPKMIARYSDMELHLRMREVWGQFCLLGWVFSHDPTSAMAGPVHFALLPDKAEMHCGTALEIKEAEIRGYLWKMRFEQRRRLDADYARTPQFAKEIELAAQIPAQGFGKPIEKLTGEQLLFLSCEYAGMLAAVRWVKSPKQVWGAPGIMNVGDSPFGESTQ